MKKKKKAPDLSKYTSVEASRFKTLFKSYTNNFKSILLFVETLSPVVLEKDKAYEEQAKKYVEDLKSKIDLVLKGGKGGKVSKAALHNLFMELPAMPELPDNNHNILLNGAFVMMIGYFEHIFTELIYCYHKYSPEGLNGKATIYLGELKQYKTLEEAFDAILNRAYEEQLRALNNFKATKDLFIGQYKISFEETIIDWDIINEARERRHLIVHNNCALNSKYLAAVNKEKVADLKTIQASKVVQVDYNYFNSVFDTLFPCGILIIMNCWGLWKTDESEDAISEMLNLSFDYLSRKKYSIPLFIGKYCNKITARTERQTDLLLRIRFNYCLALKGSGDTSEMKKELNKLKTQSLSPIFKVAYYALNDDKGKVLENLANAKVVDKLGFKDIQVWPLFANLRTDEDFMKKAKIKLK